MNDRSSSRNPSAHTLDRVDNQLKHAPEHELEDAWVIGLLHGGNAKHATCHFASSSERDDGCSHSGAHARRALPHVNVTVRAEV